MLPRRRDHRVLAGAALALLAESFGRDVWWLWRHRDTYAATLVPGRCPTGARPRRPDACAPPLSPRDRPSWPSWPCGSPSSPRTSSAASTPGAFLRIPLEGLVVVALAAGPAGPGRDAVVAVVVGVVLGAADRRQGPRHGLLRGPRPAVRPGVRLGLPRRRRRLAPRLGRPRRARPPPWSASRCWPSRCSSLLPLSVLRLTRLAAGTAARSVPRASPPLGGRSGSLCAVFGVQLAPGVADRRPRARPASRTTEVTRQVRAGLRDRAGVRRRDRRPTAFARHPRRPAADRPARQGRRRRLRRELRPGRGRGLRPSRRRSTRCSTPASRRLRAAGFSVPQRLPHLADVRRRRAGWPTPRCSPACGSTTSSATTSSSASDRLTLTGAFQPGRLADRRRRAGQHPATGRRATRSTATTRSTTPATSATAARSSATPPMPDQYTLSAFQRLELGHRPHAPLMAEIDLVSSHAPVGAAPALVDWDAVGDGSVFDGMPAAGRLAGTSCRRDPDAGAGRRTASPSSTRCDTLVSFVQTYGDDNLVLVVLGDHQPATVVTGAGRQPRRADHRRRPRPGGAATGSPRGAGRTACGPDRHAPVWPMDAFRDRFLTAYGPAAAASSGTLNLAGPSTVALGRRFDDRERRRPDAAAA